MKYLLFLLVLSGGILLGLKLQRLGYHREVLVVPAANLTASLHQDINKSIPPTACEAPLMIEIGQVDKEFRLSQAEILAALEKATQEWQDASGRRWFVIQAGGALKVNFLYDGRQSAIHRMEVEHAQLKSESQRLSTRKDLSRLDAADLLARIDAYRKRYEGANIPVPWAQHFSDPGGSSIDVFAFSNPQELHATLLHELGHAIGLGHLPQPKAIMYELRVQGTSDIHLSQYDIEAALSLCRHSDASHF